MHETFVMKKKKVLCKQKGKNVFTTVFLREEEEEIKKDEKRK